MVDTTEISKDALNTVKEAALADPARAWIAAVAGIAILSVAGLAAWILKLNGAQTQMILEKCLGG